MEHMEHLNSYKKIILYFRDAIIHPEFVILECLGEEIGVYRYKFINGDFTIEKVTINKWFYYNKLMELTFA